MSISCRTDVLDEKLQVDTKKTKKANDDMHIIERHETSPLYIFHAQCINYLLKIFIPSFT